MTASDFLGLTFLAIFIQAFFAMMEMALVSFNKVRLQYYLGQGSQKARYISYLLMHPGILFGTTLIGINTALQFGSEFSRRFYMALDLNPDYAPFTQIILVVIFAELTPLIAARRYAEHVAMLGIRLLYLMSFILRPFVLLLELIVTIVLKTFKIKRHNVSLITKEEIQRAIEAREDKQGFLKEEEFDLLMSNLFSLKMKTAKDLMQPLTHIPLVNIDSTVGEFKALIKEKYVSFVLVYEGMKDHPIGIVPVKELLFLDELTSLKSKSKSPWFVAENFNLYQLIEQFKKSERYVALVIDHKGRTLGVVTLPRILEAIFQSQTITEIVQENHDLKVHMNRSFSGSTKIDLINKTFHTIIQIPSGLETLEELMQHTLGHHPSLGESVRIGEYELIVEEAPLIGEKSILIKTF
jgi:CBS domain containing-hemolysin-like protein